MRLHCERNVLDHKRFVLVCTARFWNHQNDREIWASLGKVTSTYCTQKLKDVYGPPDYTNMWHKNPSRFV